MKRPQIERDVTPWPELEDGYKHLPSAKFRWVHRMKPEGAGYTPTMILQQLVYTVEGPDNQYIGEDWLDVPVVFQ